MKAEARKSEDELLVEAIHKTMGQMEQLKQACLRLSVNADDEPGAVHARDRTAA